MAMDISPEYSKQTDGQLVKRVYNGDYNAYDALDDRYRKRVMRIAAKLLANNYRGQEDVEDVTQIVMTELFEKIRKDGVSMSRSRSASLKGLVDVMAWRKANKRRAERYRQEEFKRALRDIRHVRSTPSHVLAHMIAQEQCEIVWRRYRAAFVQLKGLSAVGKRKRDLLRFLLRLRMRGFSFRRITGMLKVSNRNQRNNDINYNRVYRLTQQAISLLAINVY